MKKIKEGKKCIASLNGKGAVWLHVYVYRHVSTHIHLIIIMTWMCTLETLSHITFFLLLLMCLCVCVCRNSQSKKKTSYLTWPVYWSYGLLDPYLYYEVNLNSILFGFLFFFSFDLARSISLYWCCDHFF